MEGFISSIMERIFYCGNHFGAHRTFGILRFNLERRKQLSDQKVGDMESWWSEDGLYVHIGRNADIAS